MKLRKSVREDGPRPMRFYISPRECSMVHHLLHLAELFQSRQFQLDRVLLDFVFGFFRQPLDVLDCIWCEGKIHEQGPDRLNPAEPDQDVDADDKINCPARGVEAP